MKGITPTQDRAMEWLLSWGKTFTRADLMRVLGISHNNAGELIFRLHSRGKIERIAHGRYRLKYPQST